MITRRTLAGLAAGALLTPGLAAAQAQMRRTLDANTAMPEAGRRPWAALHGPGRTRSVCA